MELLTQLFDIILHLPAHLQQITADYGPWVYALLFVIVFAETGLVVTPILPGDSLLFACGALAGIGALDLWLVMGLLFAAAVLGDTVNYWIGDWLGPKLSGGKRLRFIKPEHLQRTHAFYEKYGPKTIVIARFVPIVRTFAPFVAGIGTMTYSRFMAYNVAGAFAWVLICTLGGYFFGNLPWVQENFSVVILAIIGISILPAIVEVLRERSRIAKISKTGPPA
jgi:membrane-associated protein